MTDRMHRLNSTVTRLASERRRNDPAARERARQVILANQDRLAAINDLVQQAWTLAQGLDTRGDSLTGRVRDGVWAAKYALDGNLHLLAEEPSDTYLGNMAAGGYYEPATVTPVI